MADIDNDGDKNINVSDDAAAAAADDASVRNRKPNVSNDHPIPDQIPNANVAKNVAGQYAAEVNQWLWQCHMQNFCAALPYFMIANGLRSNPNGLSYNTLLPGVTTTTTVQDSINIRTVHTFARNQERHYRLPSLWKRFAAELIDFLILFMLKLIVTFVAIDFFDIIDLEKYDFDNLKDDVFNYKAALEMTSELVVLEIIHRFVVCFFEALCLQRGSLPRGGATPGKYFVGIKVVSCENIVDLGNGHVLIRPAGDLGFGWALVRSFVKNFSLAFFFPLCFTLFMFQHNRTVYDILCSSVVVEESNRVRQQN